MTKGDQEELIAAAVAGRSLVEIGRASGLSISSVQRRLKEPEIAEAIRTARVQQRQERLGQISSYSARAISKVGELIDHDDYQLGLRASMFLLTHQAKLDGVADLEDRLEALEADVLRERER